MEDPSSTPLDAITVAPPAAGESGERRRAQCPAWFLHAANISFALLSFVLHVADVASSIAFVGDLFAHRDEHTNLNYILWGSLVLGLHLLAGIIVNFIALMERYNLREIPFSFRAKEIFICLLPWSRSWWAMWRHIGVSVRGEVSVSVVEWAAYTRLLQAVVEAAPQAIIQTYFVMKTFVYWVPLLSVCLSIANAAFSYTFFVVYKYYDNRREFPAVWKILAVALNAVFTSGGRAFATAMLAFSLGSWAAALWVFFITAINLIRWKIKTWENDRLTRIKTISLLETLFVASTRQKTAYTTFVYMVFTFVFMQRYHVHMLAWIVWGVTFAGLLLGLGLSMLTWGVYVRAYEELIFPAMPADK